MAAGDEYMIFGGRKVHIRVVEPDDEFVRRVFVLPSPLTSAFNWRKITPELAQLGCMTVVMDLPGFGESDCGDAPQDTRTRARIAWGVLDEIDSALDGKNSTWHLIGHGSACQTILDMANMFPDSVRSQVYISPVLDGAGVIPGRLSCERWFDENVLNPNGYRRFIDRLFARRADDYVADAMRRPFLRPGARESFVEMLAQRAELSPVRGFSPVMAIWGELDDFMDRRALERLKELAPEAETHALKTAGHIPMETHSHALRDYLRGWLRYVE